MHVYISASKVKNFQRFSSNFVQTLLFAIASTSSGAKKIDNTLNFVGPRGVLLDKFLLQLLWYARANFFGNVKPIYVVF